MKQTGRTASSSVNWSQLFADLESQGQIPHASSHQITRTDATFRAMYLDLEEIKRQITASGHTPPIIRIYADVLNIPDTLNWRVDRGLIMIIARRIQAASSAMIRLDLRQHRTTSLLLFADEVAGSLQCVAMTGPSSPPPFVISSAPTEGGVQIGYQGSAPAMVPRTRAAGIPFEMSDTFREVFSTEFIFASLLYDQRPEIALPMMMWLRNWSAESPELFSTFLRSSSLAALLSSQIHARSNGAAFVPYLTEQVYTTLSSSFVAEARQYESDYRALSTQSVVDADAIRLARALLANRTSQSRYVDQLLAQAEANYANADAAVATATVDFHRAKDRMDTAQNHFVNIGIPEWEESHILDAILHLALAAASFGVSIGLMLVGDEAAGASSADSAIQAAGSVATAAQAGSQVATLAQQIGRIMRMLKDLVESLNKIYSFTQTMVGDIHNIEQAHQYENRLKQMNIDTGGIDLTAAYHWKDFQQKADAAMAPAISRNIRYASDLQVAIRSVANYGQELAAAQLAAAQAGQQVVRIRLQKWLAEEEQATMEHLVDSLQVGQAPITTLMQKFYQRYIDAKSSLFASIESFRASYFYWALEPSTVTARIIDNVATMDTGLRNLTSIALDQASALRHFSPPPQQMNQIQLVIDDADVLESLRNTGRASWKVDFDAPELAGLGRIRLTTVRFWLEGARPSGGSGSVSIQATTAGGYLDRFSGTSYQFTAKPLERTFRYLVTSRRNGDPDWVFEDRTFGYVEVDGSVDHEVSYAYFEPTPFAQWKIDINSGNAGLDHSRVTRITMVIAGSAISRP